MALSRYNPVTGEYDEIEESDQVARNRQARLETFTKIFTDTESEVIVQEARVNDTPSDSHVPDMNLPVIDLKKEQPPILLPFMRETFKMTDVTSSINNSKDVYSVNCIAYAFKDGKLYLTFNLDTVDGKSIMFRKKMMRRVRIEHFALCDDYGLQSDPLVMDYHVEFAYIETASSRDDFHHQMTVTLVYKVSEW